MQEAEHEGKDTRSGCKEIAIFNKLFVFLMTVHSTDVPVFEFLSLQQQLTLHQTIIQVARMNEIISFFLIRSF